MAAGVKMELFKAEREEVLLLLERVNDAQRLATMQMKEADSGKGRRKGRDDDGDDASLGRGRGGGGGGDARKGAGGGKPPMKRQKH